MEVNKNNVIGLMPYDHPFLFVDRILELTEDRVLGEYRFREDEFFYRGHFRGNPITPGVILIECMAQIGLVAMGFYLLREVIEKTPGIAFSSSNVDFLNMVLPGETVRVESKKKYFRMGKLSCDVEMRNKVRDTVCRGNLSGLILNQEK